MLLIDVTYKIYVFSFIFFFADIVYRTLLRSTFLFMAKFKIIIKWNLVLQTEGELGRIGGWNKVDDTIKIEVYDCF